MKMTPAPPEMVALFERVTRRLPVEPRRMFGYPSAFVNGNLVTGLFQDRMMVRLAPDDRAELLAVPGAEPFAPMQGRPMKEYVVLPAAWHADEKKLARWVAKAAEYGASLPPKGKKPPATKKTVAKQSSRSTRSAAR
jgi:TfoX/Sxy family transcriptional regulator of competence genes